MTIEELLMHLEHAHKLLGKGPSLEATHTAAELAEAAQQIRAGHLLPHLGWRVLETGKLAPGGKHLTVTYESIPKGQPAAFAGITLDDLVMELEPVDELPDPRDYRRTDALLTYAFGQSLEKCAKPITSRVEHPTGIPMVRVSNCGDCSSCRAYKALRESHVPRYNREHEEPADRTP